MRIERISDTQIKFVLMMDDLEERDIKINELSYASDKTQQLFREIMTLVQDEQEFVEGETPLMFEAMRVGVDSLVVVVTKIDNAADGEKKYNLIPAARQECRYKRSRPVKQEEQANEDSYSIFSFDNLDFLAAAAVRLPEHFVGTSQIHKMDNRFFLLIKNETEDTRTTAELEAVLYEYGQKHVSNMLSHQYLLERGSVFIAEDAVDKMRMYHNA
ncbi:MAG: adaptor protein MecA [Defluviitaleaceae bacterium]|nr:adaptor protein MecA [Defluviitaleaceae bacterium]MCL2264289.1 adaptor protein MecA [Defluviitaleaceae bacterium]